MRCIFHLSKPDKNGKLYQNGNKEVQMKKTIGLLISAIFFSSSAFAQETEFKFSGEWDSFYGYAFPDSAYKHRDKRQFFVNIFEINLGAEKTFTEDYFLGLYADLYASSIRTFVELEGPPFV